MKGILGVLATALWPAVVLSYASTDSIQDAVSGHFVSGDTATRILTCFRTLRNPDIYLITTSTPMSSAARVSESSGKHWGFRTRCGMRSH